MSTVAARCLSRIRERLRRRLHGDTGSILLETVIAISLITVIMSAVGAEYVNGLSETSHQRASSVAVELADSAMEGLRALHASDLLDGRTKTAVTTEYNQLAAIPAVAGWLNGSAANLAYDNSGAPLAVPTTASTQKPGPVSYLVYTYLECAAPSTSGACLSTATQPNFVRAIVAVTWTQRGCAPATVPPATSASPTCSYTTSALFNTDGDPTFDVNQTLPPAPQIKDPHGQTVAIGDVVSVPLLAQSGKGVAPFTWALTGGSLPTGLAVSPAGLISGTVGAPTGTYSSTFSVTDAFIRKASITINWTVLPALTFASVGDQQDLRGSSVSLTVSATGGSGTGYTFSDVGNTLPPGLTVSSAGAVTGTPNARGTYPVKLQVTDSAGRVATTTFNWTITVPPLGMVSPGAQSATVGIADSLQMSATGGDGNLAWSATGLPQGLAIDPSTGLISGTPSRTGSYPVIVTVDDPTGGVAPDQVGFTWTVYPRPSITNPPDQKGTIGSSPNYAVTATCPDTPCTYTLSGQPNGVTINASTGIISGTIAANAQTSTSVVATVTDAAGATASSNPFTWTVFPAPTVTTPTGTAAEGATVGVPVPYTCPFTKCTITLSGSVPGVGLESKANAPGNNTTDTSIVVSQSSGTVYLAGTVQSSAVQGTATKTQYSPSLTIQDGGGFQPPASTATWTAYPPAPTITGLKDLTQKGNTTVTPGQAMTYTCVTGPCTITVTGAPGAVGLDTDAVDNPGPAPSWSVTGTGTIYLRGNVGATPASYDIVVTITDGNGLTDTVSATWKVT